MSSSFRVVLSVLVLAVAGGGGLWWWRHHQVAPPIAAVPAAPPAPPAAPPPPAPAPSPTPHYPVPSGASESGGDGDAALTRALTALLGKKSVRSLFNLDGIVRRFVATVDNLATENAPTEVWPVHPTPGRLDTVPSDGGLAISARNAERYLPFVHLVESTDTDRAVALYVRLYPQFQRAYEDLGYPGRYFNDRVVEVIDNLLATPTVPAPVRVKRFAVDGSVSQGDPLYVYADSTLETHTAGQKILLRMGAEDAAKLKAKLGDVRRRLVSAELPRTASRPAR